MGFLHGVISDRLRKKFHPSDRAWTPKRPPESKPMPKKGVEGIKLSPAGRKKSK